MKLVLLSLVFLFSCSLLSNRSPDEIKAEQFYDLGMDKILEKDFETARDLFSKAAKLNPKDAKIVQNLGMTYMFKKDPETALKYLNQAIELDPNNSEARGNLASIYFGREEYKKAKTHYLKLVENTKYKKNFQANTNLAYIFQKEDRPIEARKYLTILANNNKNNCLLLTRIGKIDFHLKKYQRALENFSKSIEHPCYLNPEPLYLKGLSLDYLGQYSAATKVYKELTAKFPTTFFSSFAHDRLVQIKNKTDRKRL
jgi:Flp pilus assembly protein TadD